MSFSPASFTQFLSPNYFNELLFIAENLTTIPTNQNLNSFFLFCTSVRELYKLINCNLPGHPHESARLLSYWWNYTIPSDVKTKFCHLAHLAKEGNSSTPTNSEQKRLENQMQRQYYIKKQEEKDMFSRYTVL